MSTKIIELKDMEGNILLPYAYSASHDSSGNDFGTVYATKTLVNTKADDNSVVHLTGNEIITGVKTINTSDAGTHLILKSNVIDSDVVPVEKQYDNYIDFRDKDDMLIGRVFTQKNTVGSDGTVIGAWNGNTAYYMGIESDGYAFAPTPSSASDNSTKIATTAWVNSHIDVNPNIVRTTGSQMISGKKYFKDETVPITFRNNNAEQLVIPEAYTEQFLNFEDKNGIRIASFGGAITDAGNGRAYMAASKYVNDQWYFCCIDAYIRQDATMYTQCVASDVINSIVTTTGISKAANGYFRFGNGMLIQWGTLGAAGTDATGTFNFPVAFSNTNYAINITSIAASASATSNVRANRMINYNSLTTTGCGWQQDSYADAGARWIAIGY